MTVLRLFIIFCLLSLTACGDADRARQAKFFAFGTEIDVSIYGVDQHTAENTVSALEQSFSSVNNTWHAWKPSVLSEINKAIAEQQAITVTPEVAAVIDKAKQLAISSHHLFNPAAGKLFELWGYHRDDWFLSRPPPSQQDIDNWLTSTPTMEDIDVSNGMLKSHNSMVKLGFGAFAKGYAVDAAISVLQKQGINNAIVNIGGDLRAIGSHGKRPWMVGIRHPRHSGIVASIRLQNDESVFTSGDYERFFEYQGVRYPHILDPRTGYPANEAISVTVLHQDAATADAAATALFVAGNNWPVIAKSMGIDRVMLIRPDGKIEMSAAMATRVKLADNTQTPIIRD